MASVAPTPPPTMAAYNPLHTRAHDKMFDASQAMSSIELKSFLKWCTRNGLQTINIVNVFIALYALAHTCVHCGSNSSTPWHHRTDCPNYNKVPSPLEVAVQKCKSILTHIETFLAEKKRDIETANLHSGDKLSPAGGAQTSNADANDGPNAKRMRSMPSQGADLIVDDHAKVPSPPLDRPPGHASQSGPRCARCQETFDTREHLNQHVRDDKHLPPMTDEEKKKTLAQQFRSETSVMAIDPALSSIPSGQVPSVLAPAPPSTISNAPAWGSVNAFDFSVPPSYEDKEGAIPRQNWTHVQRRTLAVGASANVEGKGKEVPSVFSPSLGDSSVAGSSSEPFSSVNPEPRPRRVSTAMSVSSSAASSSSVPRIPALSFGKAPPESQSIETPIEWMKAPIPSGMSSVHPAAKTVPHEIDEKQWDLENNFIWNEEDGCWHCQHETCLRKAREGGGKRAFGVYKASRKCPSSILKRAKEHTAKHEANAASEKEKEAAANALAVLSSFGGVRRPGQSKSPEKTSPKATTSAESSQDGEPQPEVSPQTSNSKGKYTQQQRRGIEDEILGRDSPAPESGPPAVPASDEVDQLDDNMDVDPQLSSSVAPPLPPLPAGMTKSSTPIFATTAGDTEALRSKAPSPTNAGHGNVSSSVPAASVASVVKDTGRAAETAAEVSTPFSGVSAKSAVPLDGIMGVEPPLFEDITKEADERKAASKRAQEVKRSGGGNHLLHQPDAAQA